VVAIGFQDSEVVLGRGRDNASEQEHGGEKKAHGFDL
jgi:hypothetical protein